MNNISYIILACYPDKGMKSYGSKGLLIFDKKKLLDHQISWIQSIHKKDNKNYEIIIVSNFDTNKLIKAYEDTNIKIVEAIKYNPIYTGLALSKYDGVVFIDYGCLFNPKILENIETSISNIFYIDSPKITNLEIGIIKNYQDVEHMFFDLPNFKFCNIFYIAHSDKLHILKNNIFSRINLLYFEVLNMLLEDGRTIKSIEILHKNILYFNNIKQKQGVVNFVKKLSYKS